MNHRERLKAVFNYQPYDRLPLVHFGFWNELLDEWARQGHITWEEAKTWSDGNAADDAVTARLGFDYNYYRVVGLEARLFPPFPRRVLETLPDGSRKVANENGVVILEKDGTLGIPPEVDYLLKDRKTWEEHFLPRLQFSPERAGADTLLRLQRRPERELPHGLWCGSLYGVVRDMVGMVRLAYMQSDDPALFAEIVDTLGELCFQCVKYALEHTPGGVDVEFAHFWEDICFRGGPLINPRTFRNKVGPHYRHITDLLHQHGIQIVSLDCDGLIDALVPIWLENGVNTMFPIEVGVWNASIQPWREKYGRELRGVGGVNKKIFGADRAAVDAEIERLKPLVAAGGYLPCPDHRLPLESKWEIVQYYGERMRKSFG
jgi:uroporphyrinogen decarboxylase